MKLNVKTSKSNLKNNKQIFQKFLEFKRAYHI